MDACLRPDRIGQMRRIAKSIPGVRGVHNAKIRRSGPFVFGEMHVEVQEGLAVETAHAISDRIEQEIKNSIREIDSLTIHIEPAQIEVVRVAIPIEEDRGLDSPTSPHLGKARYFLFIDVEKGVVKNWFVSRNPGVVLEKKKGVTAAQFLIEQKANVLLAKDLGEGPFHVLKDNFVRTYKLPDNMNIREIMEAFQKEELEALTPVK
jgi:predicted Fe-Mo cluster-binding NifX family protein